MEGPTPAPRPFDPAGDLAAAKAAVSIAAAASHPGRFGKTDVSFGLRGRIVLTVLLLLPLAWFVYLMQWMIGVGGLVIYGFVVLPLALRDVWKPVRRRR